MLNLKTSIASPLVFAALAAGLLSSASAATSNGFANGGFETANSAANPGGGVTYFAQGWLAAPTGNPALWSTDAHSGSHAALLTNPNGFGGSTLFQNSIDHGGLPALDAANIGSIPTLSFWAKGDVSETGNVLFSLRYLGANGDILGTSGNQFFQNLLSTSSWSEIKYQAGAIPAGTVALMLEMNTAVGPLLSNRQNAVLIDDINLSVMTAAVPEPQTYALMLAGLGLIGAAARRRRA